MLAVLGAGLVLLAVAVGLYARGSDSVELTAVAADSVGLIDPRTNRIVAQVPVGATPAAITAGAGALWALNADSQTVSRIDPESKAVKTFSTGGTPTALAAGVQALWVGDGGAWRSRSSAGRSPPPSSASIRATAWCASPCGLVR